MKASTSFRDFIFGVLSSSLLFIGVLYATDHLTPFFCSPHTSKSTPQIIKSLDSKSFPHLSRSLQESIPISEEVKAFQAAIQRDMEAKGRKNLVSAIPKGTIGMEIGVWRGEFSQLFVNVVEPKELHLADPWAFQPQFSHRLYGGSKGGNSRKQLGMDKIYSDVVERFKDVPSVQVHRNWSCTLQYVFEKDYFDWIYIDGNHYFDGAFADLCTTLKLVKVGGFLLGDDVEWKNDGGERSVELALEHFLKFEKCAKKVAIGNNFVLQRVC